MSAEKFDEKDPLDFILVMIAFDQLNIAKGAFKKKLESKIKSYQDWFNKPYYDKLKIESRVNKELKLWADSLNSEAPPL